MAQWVWLTEADDLPERADGWVIGRNQAGDAYRLSPTYGFRLTGAAPDPKASRTLCDAIAIMKRHPALEAIKAVFVVRQPPDAASG